MIAASRFRKVLLPFIVLLSIAVLNACGEAEPFNMPTEATMFVGQPSPVTPLEFIINPVEQVATGSLLAEIETVFPDRVTLTLLSLTLTFPFEGIGDILITLDPNRPSSATVFELDTSGQSSGVNTMLLSLIIQTPDQNLVLTDVLLEGDTALLELAEDLPSLGFFFQGQPQELDLSNMSVVLPGELIISGFDPQ